MNRIDYHEEFQDLPPPPPPPEADMNMNLDLNYGTGMETDMEIGMDGDMLSFLSAVHSSRPSHKHSTLNAAAATTATVPTAAATIVSETPSVIVDVDIGGGRSKKLCVSASVSPLVSRNFTHSYVFTHMHSFVTLLNSPRIAYLHPHFRHNLHH